MKLVSRYVAVGIWNTIFGVSSFISISLLMDKTPDIFVLAVSYGVSIIQAHSSQRYFVWKSKSPYFPELLKFSSAYVLQFFVNAIFLYFSEGVIDLSREVRQVIITLLLTLVFYFINKRGVFRVE
jgi:putative flippase GtrA